MNKKLLLLTVITMFNCSIVLLGCTNHFSKKVTTSINVKFTYDEIKKNYTNGTIKNIQDIGEGYVLVESQENALANIFDLYNIQTGCVETLPTMGEFVTLEKIVNENYFIFISSGKNAESTIGNFPSSISCIRIKNNSNETDNFISLRESKYFNLDYQLQSGSKSDSVISNLNINFDGMEILFEPIKGKNLEFYADYTDIPLTKTSFKEESNQIIFEIETVKLSDKLNEEKKVSSIDNQFISFYEISQKNNKTYLTITLNDVTKKYSVKTKRLPNKLPYIEIVFSE